MQELTASIESVVALASSFEELEDGVFTVLCEVGRVESAAALRARDDRLYAESPSGWRVKDRRSRSVLTRYGTVEVARRRYVDGEGATRYLLDERLDLEKRSRISPSLERLLVTLSADVSFRGAAHVVSAVVGTHVSHAAAHGRLGRRRDDVWRSRAPRPPPICSIWALTREERGMRPSSRARPTGP